MEKGNESEPVIYLHVFASYNPGGAELRITNIINHAGPGAGHAILSLNGETRAAYKLDPATGTRVFGGPSRTNALKWPFAVWKKIKQINPKVLITYNWGATDAIIGARLNRFQPVIHNECGLSNEIDGKIWRRRFVRRIILPKCHQTVVTSAMMYDLALSSFGVPKPKIAYIKTGVDSARFVPRSNLQLRGQITSDQSAVIFGYVGSLRPSKNVPMLIKAFAKIRQPNYYLALFGQGSEKASLEGLASELGVLDAIRFMGHFEDVAQVYGAFDVYVTTSKSEAASNSLLESMASGLPTVSTDIADNKLLLSDENRKFVFAHSDLDGYANGLATVASNVELRHALGGLNRDRVVAEYPLPKMVQEYLQLWKLAIPTPS